MQRITDKEFDKSFKQKLDDVSVAPPIGTFKKIEQKISKKKKAKWPFYAAAASVAALLVIGFLWKPSMIKTGITNPVVVVQVPKKDTPIAPAQTGIAVSQAPAPAKEDRRIILKNNVKKYAAGPKDLATVNTGIDEKRPAAKKIMPLDETDKTAQKIIAHETINDKITYAQPNKELPENAVIPDNHPASAIAGIALENAANSLAVSNEDKILLPRKKKRKFFAGIFQNIKEKVTDITEEVVTDNRQQTTINLGFVAITKYKN